MTKINLKSISLTALCIAGFAGFANPVFAQVVTGGAGPGDAATEVCTQITAINSVACGQNSIAGDNSTATGAVSRASGNLSTANGAGSQATGSGSTATGANSRATGAVSVATGEGSRAEASESTAIGFSSVALAERSVALGSDSIARGFSTVSVGSDGMFTPAFQRRIVNVAAGTASAISFDAVNGSQLFATNQNVTVAQTTANAALTNANTALAQNVVQDTRLSAVETVNTTQDSRLTTLEALNTGSGTRLATLETLTGNFGSRITNLELESRQAEGGIAAALALGGAVIVPDANVSMSFNLATYRGEQGFSGSVIGKVSEKVYISGGVAGSTVKGSTGGRVGVTFGF